MLDPKLTGEVLSTALPYIQRFKGQTFVVKYGGSAMQSPEVVKAVIRNVLLLQLVGIRTILVHGGGPEIDGWLTKLGLEKNTLNGLRVTDDATMEVVEMALAGRANKALVGQIQAEGGRAVGLSGRDADLMMGEALSPELGRVGKVLRVDPEILKVLSESGFIPVVCSVATDVHRQPLNVNADSAAAAIAVAVGAAKLILLTDTDGVLLKKEEPDSTVSHLSSAQAKEMLSSGAADRGMIPKLEAALEALDNGVERVHLINGGKPNSLLIEIFTDHGVGSMMSRD